MQESRLFKIVYYLIEKGKSTAPELAQKFEVSVRTMIIPGLSEPPVRTLRATIPENGSHIFR